MAGFFASLALSPAGLATVCFDAGSFGSVTIGAVKSNEKAGGAAVVLLVGARENSKGFSTLVLLASGNAGILNGDAGPWWDDGSENNNGRGSFSATVSLLFFGGAANSDEERSKPMNGGDSSSSPCCCCCGFCCLLPFSTSSSCSLSLKDDGC